MQLASSAPVTGRETACATAASIHGLGPSTMTDYGRLSEVLLATPDSVAVLEALGRVVSRLHALPCPVNVSATVEEVPWGPMALTQWHGSPPAQRRYIGLIHQDTELREVGSKVASRLTAERVWIHGDLRLENVLHCDDVRGVQLVDWEFSGLGAPEADLRAIGASLLQLHLSHAAPELGAEHRAAGLRRAWAHARSDLQHVVSSYCDAGQRLDSPLASAAWGHAVLARGMVRATYVGFDLLTSAQLRIGRALMLGLGA